MPGKTRRPRALGRRSAEMKAKAMLRGREIPEHKRVLVRMAAKLQTHFDNLSASLFFTTELRDDEEPRVALSKMLDLSRETRELLGRAFGEEPTPDLFERYKE